MTSKEKILSEVLLFTRLPKLPDYKYEGDIPWMKAVVETVKADGSESYAVAKSIDGYDFRIIKDFGSMSRIVKYGKFYPYSGIKEQYIPHVKNREELMRYLVSVYGEEREYEIRNGSDEELKRLVYMEAIRLTTINKEYEYEMYKERLKYTEDLKEEEDSKKESENPEYLKKKEELVEYQKKAAKENEEGKRKRKVRKSAK